MHKSITRKIVNGKHRYYFTYKCRGGCGRTFTSEVHGIKKTLKKHKRTCPGCHFRKMAQTLLIKPVTFRHLLTGQVVKTSSTVEFCRMANLSGNAKYHFAEVRAGRRLHHKGWALNKPVTIDTSKVRLVTQLQIARAVV
jgi:hypothetical protein